MEALILLIVLAIIGVPIGLIVAAVKVSAAVRQLEARVAQLESQDGKQSVMTSEPAGVPGLEASGADTAAAPETVAAPVPAPPLISAFKSASPEPSPAPDRAAAEAPPPVEAAVTASAPERERAVLDWEQFMGAKLFAWVGGLALFLGVAFFVKYSFDNYLVSPAARVVLGMLTGVGLIGGGLAVARRNYAITAQTLCATGIVILYSSTFAGRVLYELKWLALLPAFVFMTLITAAAFILAVRLNARVVAVLGILGGFLTPVLLSTGQDNPAALFGYIALLDAGLIAIALHRRWHFLVGLGAAATVFMQMAWVIQFFEPAKLGTAIAIFLLFNLLFLAGSLSVRRLKQESLWLDSSALAPPFAAMFFALYALSFPELGPRPLAIFALVLVADLCVLAPAWMNARISAAHLVAAVGAFTLLAFWTLRYLEADLLASALGLYVAFAIVHSVFPIALQRWRSAVFPAWTHYAFPLAVLFLMVQPIAQMPEVSRHIWPVVVLLDALLFGIAFIGASAVALIAALALTMFLAAVWLFAMPAQLTILPASLFVIAGFGTAFFGASIYLARKLGHVTTAGDGTARVEDQSLHLIILSLALPFLLLFAVISHLPLKDPSPVFGVALLLSIFLLSLARWWRLDWAPAVALAGVLLLAYGWHSLRFDAPAALPALAWYLVFLAVFTGFPFLFYRQFATGRMVWIAAALAGPLQFYLVYDLVAAAWPNDFMGLVPAAFAAPPLLGFRFILRRLPKESPVRLTQLAWFGGVSLWFLALIMPIQFEKQWITLGWAVQGAALLWLCQRVPHPGLRVAGLVLLAISFIRLALNPSVLTYYPPGDLPILNWYTYTYGIVIACLAAGARFLAPPRHMVLGKNAPPLLWAMAAVLAFLLVNLQIADYFSTGTQVTLEFTGHFARDMTYTIAWASFALGLLAIGFWKTAGAARYAGLGLLSVALLKLFFHDLANLAQLYRIGAFVIVAVIAILASVLYQRFLPRTTPR